MIYDKIRLFIELHNQELVTVQRILSRQIIKKESTVTADVMKAAGKHLPKRRYHLFLFRFRPTSFPL